MVEKVIFVRFRATIAPLRSAPAPQPWYAEDLQALSLLCLQWRTLFNNGEVINYCYVT